MRTTAIVTMCIGLAFYCLLAVAVLSGTGCGTFSQGQIDGMDRTLDAVAETVDPAYGLAVVACDAQEGVIVVRTGTTYAEDVRALETIRERCTRVFDAFEAVRTAHLAARQLVVLAATDEDSALGRALIAVGKLKAAWDALRLALPAEWLTAAPEAPQ